tara:strand:+ start:365 stop:850 length:486 start_codon:yes stop_codon:yes gene_type:complete
MAIPITFKKHDDYMTPKSAWEAIDEFIPKDKVIWEAFKGDGKSGEYLTELGCEVIHNDNDFFQSNEGEVIITNPAFSIVKDIIPRLVELDKPFILLMPVSKIATQYFKPFMNKIQIIIPDKRIEFVKLVDGKEVKSKSRCAFDCFYYCYKMNLDRDIIWLE